MRVQLLAAFSLLPIVFSCIPTTSPDDRPTTTTTTTTEATTTTTLPYCTTTTTAPPTCPSGWTQFQSDCYIFEATPAFTTDAVTSCMNLGGHLTSILSAAENTFVANLAGNVMIYLGIARVGTANTNANFANLDGTAFSYSNWDTAGGQPDNGGGGTTGTQYCITMDPTGLWEDIMCSVTQYPYVCKQPLV